MSKNNITIRLERKEEYREVENMVRESFWNVYRPGCMEHFMLHELRKDVAFVPELDFVMELDGTLIGQNMFMRAAICADDGQTVPIMTMGPICIAPAYKRQGYGKILLDYSVEKARELGCGALCLEGNIDFYGKSGFTYAEPVWNPLSWGTGRGGCSILLVQGAAAWVSGWHNRRVHAAGRLFRCRRSCGSV